MVRFQVHSQDLASQLGSDGLQSFLPAPDLLAFSGRAAGALHGHDGLDHVALLDLRRLRVLCVPKRDLKPQSLQHLISPVAKDRFGSCVQA